VGGCVGGWEGVGGWAGRQGAQRRRPLTRLLSFSTPSPDTPFPRPHKARPSPTVPHLHQRTDLRLDHGARLAAHAAAVVVIVQGHLGWGGVDGQGEGVRSTWRGGQAFWGVPWLAPAEADPWRELLHPASPKDPFPLEPAPLQPHFAPLGPLTCPTLSLIPYFVTIARARAVACFRSLLAPLVTSSSPKISSSATRPWAREGGGQAHRRRPIGRHTRRARRRPPDDAATPSLPPPRL
jgi:hypothetical protein